MSDVTLVAYLGNQLNDPSRLVLTERQALERTRSKELSFGGWVNLDFGSPTAFHEEAIPLASDRPGRGLVYPVHAYVALQHRVRESDPGGLPVRPADDFGRQYRREKVQISWRIIRICKNSHVNMLLWHSKRFRCIARNTTAVMDDFASLILVEFPTIPIVSGFATRQLEPGKGAFPGRL